MYSEGCEMLEYWEHWHIQNITKFKILTYLGPETYLESCLFRHIQAVSGIFNNFGYNSINFLFFHFNLTYFSTKSRDILFDYNDVNFNARLSLLNQCVIFQNSVIKKSIKLTFSLENKFYDRKESSLTIT